MWAIETYGSYGLPFCGGLATDVQKPLMADCLRHCWMNFRIIGCLKHLRSVHGPTTSSDSVRSCLAQSRPLPSAVPCISLGEADLLIPKELAGCQWCPARPGSVSRTQSEGETSSSATQSNTKARATPLFHG